VCRFFRVEETSAKRCRVTCARKDEPLEVIHTFELTIEQAIEAKMNVKWERGQDGKFYPEEKFPWKTSPADMLLWRTCGRATKVTFGDVVHGMTTPEDVEDLAAADAMERAGGEFAPAPVSPFVKPISAAAKERAAERTATGEDVVDAELVGSGDAAWDDLIGIIGPLAGVDTAGWLPSDLCEEWDRRIAGATTKGTLNAFAPWIGEASKRAATSKNCADAATHMRTSFNAQSAELGKRAKAAPSS
jgi:hypothetical protein